MIHEKDIIRKPSKKNKWLISFIALIALELSSHSPFAALSTLDRSVLSSQNKLSNPGWEAGKAGWTKSAGTYSTTTSFATLGNGAAGSFDSSSASQTLTSDAVTITSGDGLSGQNMTASCRFKCDSGTCTHKIQLYDGTNVLQEDSITSSTTTWLRKSVTAIAPASGTIAARIISVASNEPILYIDDCYLGMAEGFNIFQVSQPKFIGSAFFATTGSCNWDRASTSLGAPSTTAACPGPTVEFNPGPGVIQTTDTDLPQVTVNALPSGEYDAYFTLALGTSGGAADVAVAISDGTTVSGRTAGNSTSGASAGSTVIGHFSYLDSGNRTFTLHTSASANTARIYNNANNLRTQFFIHRSAGVQDTQFKADVYNWRVDANISGANIALTTSAITSYQGVTDTGLSLTNNSTGNVSAFIPCSSTNDSSGSTCSVGSESVGVAFTPPSTGSVEACAAFTINQNSGEEPVWEIVETGNTDQTIVQTGQEHLDFGGGNAGGSTLTVHSTGRVCGVFSLATLAKHTFRLFYVQAAATGSGGTNLIQADAGSGASGGRDIHWTVRPVTQNFPVPLLLGSVSSNSSGQERIERAQITVSNSAAAVVTQSGSWISVANGAGAGLTTATLSGFTGAPACSCTVVGAATTSATHCIFTSEPTSTTVLISRNRAGSAENGDVNIICMGPR